MSKYVTANHTHQGSKIGAPATGMGSGSKARFYYAPDRLTMTFNMSTMFSIISSATGTTTTAPAPDEFYSQIKNMLQMVTRGLAVMKAEGVELNFLTTMRDANEYQAQRERIAAACGMGNLCEDCPLSTRCPDLS